MALIAPIKANRIIATRIGTPTKTTTINMVQLKLVRASATSKRLGFQCQRLAIKRNGSESMAIGSISVKKTSLRISDVFVIMASPADRWTLRSLAREQSKLPPFPFEVCEGNCS
jgi:hypothetical protein